MAHFLTKDRAIGGMMLGRPHMAVCAKYEKGRLVLSDDRAPYVARADARFVPLPEGVAVLGRNGNTLEASGKFWVSVETCDPFHAIVDAPALPLAPA